MSSSSCGRESSPPSVATSTRRGSSRSRRRSCSRATAARSRTRSSRTRTSSTRISTCASRPSSTSSGSSSAGSSASTRSARTSATRASRTSTSPSSRCSSGTRRTPTSATRWTGSRRCSSRSPWRRSARQSSGSAGTRSTSKRPWRRLGFVESLEAHELWTRDEGELRAWLTERGVDTEADKDWPQLVDHAFGHFVEPSLIEPTIVYGHPVELSPFARVTDDDESITERFEYFAAGMELGNAYTEINDAEEQQRRFDEQSAHVEGVRGDPDYVEALSYGMPPTGGLGLGIDRLVMLLSGRETIRDVILFPALRSRRPLGAARHRGLGAPREVDPEVGAPPDVLALHDRRRLLVEHGAAHLGDLARRRSPSRAGASRRCRRRRRR